MNTNFTPINMDTWPRRQEFNNFLNAGCGFSINAEIDVTNLKAYAKCNSTKFYPSLIAVTVKAINQFEEYKFNYVGEYPNCTFGTFEVLHPIFFDVNQSGNIRALCAEYDPDILKQINNIEHVRNNYINADCYIAQSEIPKNAINISCIPWISFTSMSFCLQYCATYFTPIITYGKYFERNNRIIIPLSVYCNHAVNDGYHAARIFKEIQKVIDNLKY